MREYTVKQVVAEHNGVYDAWEVGIAEGQNERDALVRFLDESKVSGNIRAYKNIRAKGNFFTVDIEDKGWNDSMFILEENG